jgi:hypothetical protein
MESFSHTLSSRPFSFCGKPFSRTTILIIFSITIFNPSADSVASGGCSTPSYYLLPRAATRLLCNPLTTHIRSPSSQMVFRSKPLLLSFPTPALCVSELRLELIYQLSCTSKLKLRYPLLVPFHLVVFLVIDYFPVDDFADSP